MTQLQWAIASLLAFVAVVSPRASGTQMRQRPYDVALVRAAAAAIQREVTTPSRQEEALAGPLQFISESLSGLPDFKDVPEEVLDAVAVLAGSGRMASETLIRFGDRAVAALIRSARPSSPRPPYPGGAMDVLQEMLLRRTAEHALSEGSRAAVRGMVHESLNDKRLGSVELAALGCLAVATADPELRTAAERLTDAATLTSRGVPAASQAYVIARIRRALDTIPKRLADEPRR